MIKVRFINIHRKISYFCLFQLKNDLRFLSQSSIFPRTFNTKNWPLVDCTECWVHCMEIVMLCLVVLFSRKFIMGRYSSSCYITDLSIRQKNLKIKLYYRTTFPSLFLRFMFRIKILLHSGTNFAVHSLNRFAKYHHQLLEHGERWN